MHDNVVILPEGGRDFMPTLRLAALYSEKVHVFSTTKELMLNFLSASLGFAAPNEGDIDDLDEYLAIRPLYKKLYGSDNASAVATRLFDHPAKAFLKLNAAYRADLETLSKEGALISIFDHFVEEAFTPRGIARSKDFHDAIGKLSQSAIPRESIPNKYLDELPATATICSLFRGLLASLVLLLDFFDKSKGTAWEQVSEDVDRIAVALYFMISSHYAAYEDCVAISADHSAQQFFDSCRRRLFSDGDQTDAALEARNRIRPQVGEAVLLDTVPDVSRLPIEEILEIRRRREPELRSFREGISRLTAEIDPSLHSGELHVAISNKVEAVVKPALDEMRRSIRSMHLGSLSDVARDTLTAGGVPFLISSTLGAPQGMTPIQLAAVGVLVQKLYDFTIGKHVKRKQILAACPWSVLFDLQNRSSDGQ